MSAKQRLEAVESRILRACEAAGRPRDSVRLIAVSKTYPADAIQELYDLGIRDFGESRFQEALEKIEGLPTDIVWHFIGPLQSNKARKVAEVFSVIHTLDSESQLSEIAKSGREIEAFIQLNVAEEAQKRGISPLTLDPFLQLVLQCKNVHFLGLMGIGPAGMSDLEAKDYFGSLANLNRSVGGRFLSMGMSGDFELAIQEGSTHVRVGSALFGAR